MDGMKRGLGSSSVGPLVFGLAALFCLALTPFGCNKAQASGPREIRKLGSMSIDMSTDVHLVTMPHRNGGEFWCMIVDSNNGAAIYCD